MVSTVTFMEGLEAELKRMGFELTQLKKDLEAYFDSNKRKKPAYLGKDAPFLRPESMFDAEVHHLHVYVNGVSCHKTWLAGKTSNSYLVYTSGDLDHDQYLVMDVIQDDAHNICKSHSLMRGYKQKAKDFRDRN